MADDPIKILESVLSRTPPAAPTPAAAAPAPPAPASVKPGLPGLKNLVQEAVRAGAKLPVNPLRNYDPNDKLAASLVSASLNSADPVQAPEDLARRRDIYAEDAYALFQSAGLRLPMKRLDMDRYNTWARKFHLLQRNTSPGFEGLEARLAGADRALKPALDQGLRLLYRIQKTPIADPGENRALLRDMWTDWTRTRAPEGSQPPPVSDEDLDTLSAIHNKLALLPPEGFAAEARKRLTPEQYLFFARAGGTDWHAFRQNYQEYYLSRLRLEALTRQPLNRDKPPKINPEQARYAGFFDRAAFTPPGEASPLYLTSLDVKPDKVTSIPRVPDWPLDVLLPVLPDLAPILSAWDEEDAKAKQNRDADRLADYEAFKRDVQERGLAAAFPDSEYAKLPQFKAFKDRLAVHDLSLNNVYYYDKTPTAPLPPFPDPSFLLSTDTRTRRDRIRANVAQTVSNVPLLLNAATLGLFEVARSNIEQVGQIVGTAAWGRPGAYEAYLKSIPKHIYMGLMSKLDSKGTQRLYDLDRFWRENYPVSDPVFDALTTDDRITIPRITEIALKRLENYDKNIPWYGRPPGTLPAAFGLTEPTGRALLGDLAETFLEDGANVLLMAVGGKGLHRAVNGHPPLRNLKIPGSRWSHLEQSLAWDGTFSPAAGAHRTALLADITKSLEKVKDTPTAKTILGRLQDELETRGPLDAPLTAATTQALDHAAQVLDALPANSKLSPEGRRALAALPEAIAELGPDAYIYGVHGSRETISNVHAAARARRAAAYADTLERLPNLPFPEVLQTFLGKNFTSAAYALVERWNLFRQVNQRRGLARSVTRDAIDHTRRTLGEEVNTGSILEASREQYINSYNERVRNVFEAWRTYETKGGHRPVPNPALTQAMWGELNELVRGTGAYTIEHLLADPARWSQVAGKEASALARNYRSPKLMMRTMAATRIKSLADSWLSDHSVPGFVRVEPNPRHNAAFASALEKKIGENISRGELADLTPAEAAALSRYLSDPLDPRIPRRRLEALDKDIAQSDASVQHYASALLNLEGFLGHIDNLDPLNPSLDIKIPPDVLAYMDQLAGSPHWKVLKKGYTTLSPGAAPETLTALEAWSRAKGELNAQSLRQEAGGLRYDALDLALASALHPNQVLYHLRDNFRMAEDRANGIRYDLQLLQDKLEKQLTPAQMQELQVALANGDASHPEAARLMQHHNMRLLWEGFRAGVMPPQKLTEWANNLKYYHGFYEETPSPPTVPYFRSPPRYRPMIVQGDQFKFQIPHDSWYVAYREPGKESFSHKKGFKDQAAAEAWLDSAKLEEGAEVGIFPPQPLGAKEIAGMVSDASIAAGDLTAKYAHDVAGAYAARAIANSPFAVSDPAAANLTPGKDGIHRDPYGKAWIQITDDRAPALKGKYVHSWIFDYLTTYNRDFSWLQALGDKLEYSSGIFDYTLGNIPARLRARLQKDGDMQAIFKRKDNPLLDYTTQLAERIFGRVKETPSAFNKAVSTTGNLVGLSKVGVSYTAHAQQWTTNLLINAPAAGLNTLSPDGFFYYVRYAKDGLESLLNKTDDPIWRNLAFSGHLDRNRLAASRRLLERLQDVYHGLEGTQARLSRAQDHLADLQATGATPSAIVDAALHVDKLRSERNTLSLKQARTLFGHLMGALKAELPILKGLLSGREVRDPATGKLTSSTRLTEEVFGLLGIADNLTKYAVAKHHLVNRGATMENAMAHIGAFMQNLHQQPEAIKSLSARFGGNKFTTYPWNQMRVFSNIIKHRPLWFAKYLLTMAAWNYAMDYGNGRDPEDQMHRFANSLGYASPDPLTSTMYLLSRFNLPGGRAVSSDPVFGWFLPQSPLARNTIKLAEGDDYGTRIGKAILSPAVGFATRFGLGSVLFNTLGYLQTGRDHRNQPLQGDNSFGTVGNVVSAFLSNITPDWTPVIGRDFKEIEDAYGTNYRNITTGEQKSLMDYFLRRAFAIVPRNELTPEMTLRVAIEAALHHTRPDRPKTFWAARLDEGARYYLYSKGQIDSNGFIRDTPASRALLTEWFKEHPSEILNADNSTSERATDFLAKLKSSTRPSLISAWDNLSLDEKLVAYCITRREYSDLPVDLLNYLEDSVTSSLRNAPDELSFANLRTAYQGWFEDPNLPESAKLTLDRWFSLARKKDQARRQR